LELFEEMLKESYFLMFQKDSRNQGYEKDCYDKVHKLEDKLNNILFEGVDQYQTDKSNLISLIVNSKTSD